MRSEARRFRSLPCSSVSEDKSWDHLLSFSYLQNEYTLPIARVAVNVTWVDSYKDALKSQKHCKPKVSVFRC